jgi:hypothetical protein
MTQEDANRELFNELSSVACGSLIKMNNTLIDKIYDDFGKELKQLEKDRDYWKLSFHKQVEATR